ncbi:hypothetical protein [Hymenobacter sp. CRA2]|uniref:hypothetical protein n=1 Tax=Hymenobacter sp. CRA2 TaxID=1955620 RepID=UPI00098F562A|nr:hypothetical protein [Hymenobacter sp. CRA2]OON68606.1 hypothetical protein B0919_13280 [Hymenobacter sp. CRA2]
MQQTETTRYGASGRVLGVDRELGGQRVVELTPATLRLYDFGRLVDAQPCRREEDELQLYRGAEVSQRLKIDQLSATQLQWHYEFAANDGSRQVVNEHLTR